METFREQKHRAEKTNRDEVNVEYKIESTSEAAFDLDEFVLSMGRISTKREDILEAIGLDSLKSMVDLLNRHIGAGEMHHGLNTDHVLHLVGNVKGEIGGGATGAPSNVAEGRIMSHHAVHPLEEVIDTVLRLRREELEGEHHSAAIAGGGCPDLVNHLHLHYPFVEYQLQITTSAGLPLSLQINGKNQQCETYGEKKRWVEMGN